MSAFLDSLDIANRALDHLGLPHILSVDEDSRRNQLMASVYDKLREAELERNIWVFAKRKVVLRPIAPTSRLLAPAEWNEDETYLPGSIVADGNGDLWISWQAENVGNQPGVSDMWDSYYGPMAVDVWASGTAYYAGEFVYVTSTSPKGTFVIFMSKTNGNTDTPTTGTAWDATATYGLNDRVLYSGTMYRSIITDNINLTPATPPLAWSAGTTYAATNTALGSDGLIYTSIGNGNLGNDPISDGGVNWTQGDAAGWQPLPTQYTASQNWLPIFANMTNVPEDSLSTVLNNPNSNTSLHAFRAPNQAMRRARIGYRNHTYPDDLEPHGDYLLSADAVLLYEFVANVRDVRKFHAMFCEGLATRMAAGTCKGLTGKDPSQTSLNAEYTRFMSEARIVNGIEEGPQEPDEDEYITVRTGGPGGYTSGATNWWN